MSWTTADDPASGDDRTWCCIVRRVLAVSRGESPVFPVVLLGEPCPVRGPEAAGAIGVRIKEPTVPHVGLHDGVEAAGEVQSARESAAAVRVTSPRVVQGVNGAI